MSVRSLLTEKSNHGSDEGGDKANRIYFQVLRVKAGSFRDGNPEGGFLGGKVPVVGGIALAKRFGLSPDLAEKISTKVNEIQTARYQMESAVLSSRKS